MVAGETKEYQRDIFSLGNTLFIALVNQPLGENDVLYIKYSPLDVRSLFPSFFVTHVVGFPSEKKK